MYHQTMYRLNQGQVMINGKRGGGGVLYYLLLYP